MSDKVDGSNIDEGRALPPLIGWALIIAMLAHGYFGNTAVTVALGVVIILITIVENGRLTRIAIRESASR